MYLILGYPVLFIVDKVPLVYQQDHHIYSLLLRAKYLLIAMKGNELTMSLISKRVKQGERFVSNFFEKGYFVQKNDYFLQHEILNDDRWMAIWDYYCKWFQKFMVREFFCFVFCTTQRQVKLHVASFPVAYFSTLFSLEESDFILGDWHVKWITHITLHNELIHSEIGIDFCFNAKWKFSICIHARKVPIRRLFQEVIFWKSIAAIFRHPPIWIRS